MPFSPGTRLGAYENLSAQGLDFHPTWGPKGAELFFVPTAADGRLAAVSLTTKPSVTFGSAASLPALVTANRISTDTRAYDILPEGRFVGLVDPSDTGSPPARSPRRCASF